MTADYSTTPRSNRVDPAEMPSLARARSALDPLAPKGPVTAGDCPNVLARNTVFSGTIEVTGSIRLEGTFQGELVTEGTVHVVPAAEVKAKVQAAYVVIGGHFEGDVTCDNRVDLLSDCRATGTLSTQALTVEEGALFDGDVAMTRRGTGR